MKKIIALLLVALMAVSLVACGSSTANPDLNNPINTNNQTEAPTETEAPNNIETNANVDATVNVSESDLNQVVYEKGGIKVTATEVGFEEYYGPKVTFLVENDTEKDVTVSTDDLTVNGITISSSLYASVSAGKNVYEDLSIYEEYLTEYNITAIGTLGFSLNIYESESYDNIDKSDRIDLVIDANVKTDLNTNGELIYDDNNVKVYNLDPLKENDDYYTYISTLLIVNESKTNLSISCEDVSVNGFMMDPYCYARVPAGSASYSDFYYSNDDLKENKIDAIEEIEFKLDAYDYVSYDDIFESDTIKLTVD